jgi:methionyl-tRNA formyltransferase
VPTLRALVGAGHQIVQVVSQPDRPAGRGRTVTPTAAAQAALSMDLPVLRTNDINSEASLPAADAMVVIAFGQKISEQVVHKPRLGSINLHSSRLPLYRGAAPINWAILGGLTITGNSVIRLAPKMDAGAILAQSKLEIGELETAGELHDRLAIDGASQVLGVLEALANGTAVETEQDQSKATIAKKLSREAARIDWGSNADAIARQIRGMYPWPGCRVEVVEGDRVIDTLTLVRARTGQAETSETRVGVLVEVGDTIAVTTENGGFVELVEVQPAGKKPMLLEAYRRGHRWEPGMVFRSI